MSKSKLKKLLGKATGCGAQHDGRPCGTCFFGVNEELTNQDRQTVLLYRGDYNKEDLDNLPDDIDGQLERIQKIFLSS